MDSQNQLVFFGEILPGHDAEAVKASLATLLKLQASQVDAVFSGRRVVLRKGLALAEAERYVAHLEKSGVRVLIEAMTPPASPAAMPVVAPTPVEPIAAAVPAESATATAVPVPSAPAALAIAPAAVDDMTCPKCGEVQPKRTLCRSCSVDMKRYIEAQQTAEQEVREERMVARTIAQDNQSQAADDAGLFGLGFDGRLGRIAYLGGCFLSTAGMMFFAALTLQWMSILPLALGMLVLIFFCQRMIILRCHDCDLTGWLSLLAWVPYVGGLFTLLILIWPGSKDDNRYGSPRSNIGIPMALGSVVAMVLVGMFAFRQVGDRMPQLMAMAGVANASAPKHGSAVRSSYKSAHGEVEVFTANRCTECTQAIAYMQKNGISYIERNVQENEEDMHELMRRGGTGVPFFFVGQQSMPGFDPDKLDRMLASQ